jgi:hypothetical protein
MKSLERMIKRERNARYRYLKKLFKARDAASKYINRNVAVSALERFLNRSPDSSWATSRSRAKTIAKEIIDRKGDLSPRKPFKPPTQAKPIKSLRGGE